MTHSVKRRARIYYARVDEFWRKEQKYAYLEEMQHCGNIEWQEIEPDAKHNWLTVGMHSDFDEFMPVGTKQLRGSNERAEKVFETYGRGVATSRDSWAYNFDRNTLEANIQRMIATYNNTVFSWHSAKHTKPKVDDFVNYDNRKIAWSRDLKQDLKRGRTAEFSVEKIRISLYRPYTRLHLFLDRVLNEEVYIIPSIFPTPKTEPNNSLICIGGYGRKSFATLATNVIPDLNLYADPAQCFPFYTYNEDGTNRRENITDWALEQFRAHYKDKSISKWNIFHYVYAALHHPLYRERYSVNLKRELPRIPFAPDFHALVEIGKQLAQIHINYEQQSEYPLERIENPRLPLDWRVEKMKLSKDKRSLIYNDFLTLSGIPSEVFEYRLGNRAALDWIVDQYQVCTDKRSGITNDPNRSDDPEYIVRLIGQVVTVSLETVRLVQQLNNLTLVS